MYNSFLFVRGHTNNENVISNKNYMEQNLYGLADLQTMKFSQLIL